MKKRKFKPCPRCGCKSTWTVRITGSRQYYIECPACHQCGPTKLFKFRARRAWNKLW